MSNTIKINNRIIGQDHPVYIIAEMSANHNQDFEKAVKILEAAKEAGAEAVKLQTYTSDTMTIDCDKDYFHIKETLWDGKRLYDLYGEAYTPWDWHPKLKGIADKLGLHLFSTPFDHSAVDFLEHIEVPAYKIASCEIIDLPLITLVANTGKPIIMSAGMSTLEEINEATRTAIDAGAEQIALLKCTSAYPAPPEEMNLRTITHMIETLEMPIGLSDHTLGTEIPIAAVSQGACIIEKHLTLSRKDRGPDSAFSLEPNEFKSMVKSIHVVEKALGKVSYQCTGKEKFNHVFRRSLFVVKDIQGGEIFTEKNIRSIRPGHGLQPKFITDILGRRAAKDIEFGTPLDWKLIE